MFLLGSGCTILIQQASSEKYPSTDTLGGSDGHHEGPDMIFVPKMGSHWGGKFYPNLKMSVSFAHKLVNLCGGRVSHSQSTSFWGGCWP